ncbi:MAG: type II secretion system protein N [Sandaracinobacteroides sp.]
MPVSRFNPGHLLLAILLLCCAVLAWRAIAAARAPFPEPPRFAAPALADRALLARFDPFFPARAGSGSELPVTALPFSLHGVRADSATGRGSAIIATGDGSQLVYGVGDALTEGVTLAAIAADHVVLDRGGVREALWIDTAGTEAVQRFDPGQQPVQPGLSALQQGPGSGEEPEAADPAPPSVTADEIEPGTEARRAGASPQNPGQRDGEQ